jgi:polyhydroxybutyrate depolymerase
VDTITINTASGPRTALVSNNTPKNAPLLLMLHGTGGNAHYAAAETRWEVFAQRHGFTVAFPQGLPVDPSTPPKFLTNPQRWNDGSTRPGDPFHTEVDDVAFLDALIEQFNAPKIFLCGFSNGAGMTFRYAVEGRHRLAAIAPVAGYCAVKPTPNTLSVPTLYIVGDADLLIPLRGGPVRLPWGGREVMRPSVAETLAPWAKAVGADGGRDWIEEPAGVTTIRYTGPVRMEQVIVNGLGHHWPAGLGQFNVRIAGPLSDRLDGCAKVWEFFEGS